MSGYRAGTPRNSLSEETKKSPSLMIFENSIEKNSLKRCFFLMLLINIFLIIMIVHYTKKISIVLFTVITSFYSLEILQIGFENSLWENKRSSISDLDF